MKVSEFLQEAQAQYLAQFPESLASVKLHRGLGNSVTIRFYLASGKDEFQNGIPQNDMFSMLFFIYGANGESLPSGISLSDDMPEALELTSHHREYTTKATEKWLYASHKSVSFRKTKGNAEKILLTLEKFVTRLKNNLLESIESGEIHPSYAEILSQKIDHEVS